MALGGNTLKRHNAEKKSLTLLQFILPKWLTSKNRREIRILRALIWDDSISVEGINGLPIQAVELPRFFGEESLMRFM
jgi:hypothetical protein